MKWKCCLIFHGVLTQRNITVNYNWKCFCVCVCVCVFVCVCVCVCVCVFCVCRVCEGLNETFSRQAWTGLWCPYYCLAIVCWTTFFTLAWIAQLVAHRLEYQNKKTFFTLGSFDLFMTSFWSNPILRLFNVIFFTSIKSNMFSTI